MNKLMREQALGALSIIEYHHDHVTPEAFQGFIDTIRAALEAEPIGAVEIEGMKRKPYDGMGLTETHGYNAALDAVIEKLKEETK